MYVQCDVYAVLKATDLVSGKLAIYATAWWMSDMVTQCLHTLQCSQVTQHNTVLQQCMQHCPILILNGVCMQHCTYSIENHNPATLHTVLQDCVVLCDLITREVQSTMGLLQGEQCSVQIFCQRSCPEARGRPSTIAVITAHQHGDDE